MSQADIDGHHIGEKIVRLGCLLPIPPEVPPRGQNSILAGGWSRETLSEVERELRHRDPEWPPERAINWAFRLLYNVQQVASFNLPPDDPDHVSDRSAVNTIYSLWRSIPVGRLLLQVWEKEISKAREVNSKSRDDADFRCCVGRFTTATRATQELSERVLEEVWRVGELAAPDNDSDGVFSWTASSLGYMPAFRVDWWYKVLPVLRRSCADLGMRFEVDPRHPDGWCTALEREFHDVECSQRRESLLTNSTLRECHNWAGSCLQSAVRIHTWAHSSEQEPGPLIIEDLKKLDDLCRYPEHIFEPELKAFTEQSDREWLLRFGEFSENAGENAHLICFALARKILHVLWEAADPESLEDLRTDHFARIDFDCVDGNWPAIRTALLAYDLPDLKEIVAAAEKEYARLTTDGRKSEARTATPAPAANVEPQLAPTDPPAVATATSAGPSKEMLECVPSGQPPTVTRNEAADKLIFANRVETAYRFERDGDFWMIRFGDENTKVKHATGMAYLAELLKKPHTEMPSILLEGARGKTAGEMGERYGDELTIQHQQDADAGDDNVLKDLRAELRNIELELAEATEAKDEKKIEISTRTRLDFLKATKKNYRVSEKILLGTQESLKLRPLMLSRGNAAKKAHDRVKYHIDKIKTRIEEPHYNVPAFAKHIRRHVQEYGNRTGYIYDMASNEIAWVVSQK